MKVSFDFDSTLSIPSVQKVARELVKRGVEVWIVTSRVSERFGLPHWNNDLYKVAEDCGIKKENIHYTEGGDKWEFLENKEFLFHLDDCTIECELIKENTDVVPICHFDWGIKYGGKENWKKIVWKLVGLKNIEL
jgi:hypothetical protein